MAGTPEIEALEAPETPEEENIDELEEALEASRGKSDEPEVDEGGDDTPEVVSKEEPEEDTAKEPDEGAEEVSEEEVDEKTPPLEESELERHNKELRQLLRDQRKEMAVMRAQLGRLEKGVSETFSDEEKEPPELSNIEKLQVFIGQIGQERGPILETLVEAMELKPEYADLREVCSRENFDTVFEQVAEVISKKEGLDPVEVAYSLEAEVWQMPNPYKYMYGIIKDNLPQYQKEPAKKVTKKVTPKKPAEAPASIAAVGGSDADTKSGWSAKRIDDLPEDELSRVPNEVYEKYLRGELD